MRRANWMGRSSRIAMAALIAGTGLLVGCETMGKAKDAGGERVFALTSAVMPDGTVEFRVDKRREGNLVWRVNGIAQPSAEDQPVLSLKPQTGEQTVTAELLVDGQRIALDRVRLYGQEITATAPVLDGVLGDDWNDPPVAVLRGDKQPPGWSARFPATDAEARVRVLWTTTGDLWFGLESNKVPDAGTIDAVQLTLQPVGKPVCNLALAINPTPEGNVIGARLRNGSATRSEAIRTAYQAGESGATLEVALTPDDLGFTVQPGEALNFQVVYTNGATPLVWNYTLDDQDYGIAVVLPDPSATPPAPRQQLHGGETALNVSPEATKDATFLTPLPVEKPGEAAYLPPTIVLEAPWEGTFELEGAYGYESKSWTHQTIGNPNSANDFFAIDVKMETGVPILAAAAGRVVSSGRRGDSYGNYVVIDHGHGVQSVYAHLDSLRHTVDKGEPEVTVRQGELLGLSGSTGTSRPHLHFAVHTGARASHSGANVGGVTTVPEPLSGHYGLWAGHLITSENRMVE